MLQHALARMWIAACERVSSTGSKTIALSDADYRAIGTLEGALSQHADAIMAELVGREHVVEAVFRALSERDAEGRATRRVLRLRQLIAETGLPEADVIAVVDRFRAPDCAFLLPAGGGLTPETRIDVVHEALLRRWKRLTASDPTERGWLDREDEDGQYYRSLLARIDNGETTLQLGSVTERYAWWTSVPRTDAWAMRYGGRHGRVDAFFAASLAALAESERAKARADADELERRKQKERATRRFLVVTSSIAAIAIVLLVVTFFALLGSQRTTNASLVNQSTLVARDAESLIDRGDATNAALLALEVLPQHLADPDRPFTWAAYGALTDALANVREIRDYRLFGSIIKLEYSPDGSRFVAQQSDGTIWIWKIGAPNPERLLRAKSYARDVGFSADGSFVACGSNDGSVHVWNARTGALIRVIHGYRGGVDRATFSVDGQRLLTSSAEDNVTRLYDVSTGHMVREVRGGITAYLTRTLGTFDRRIITIDAAHAVILWDATLAKALRVFSAPNGSIVDATLSFDERKVAIAYTDNSASVYDAGSGRRLAHLVNRDGTLDRIEVSRDGSELVTIGGSYARVWDISTGTALTTIPTNLGESYLPDLSRDGQKIVVPSDDGSLGIYSATLGARLVNVAGKSADIADADLSIDGRRLLVVNDIDGIVREWDVSTNTSQILDTIGSQNDIAVAPGGALFAVADTSAIHVYDAHNGTNVRTLRESSTSLPVGTHVAFAPDGRTLIASRDQFMGVDRFDWKRSKRLPPFITARSTEKYYAHLAYAPDGQTFVSTSNGLIRIQDARTGSVRRLISANGEVVGAVQFSADGKRLVAGSNDGWIRVYDPRSGRRIVAFPAHRNWVLAARFSPDGRLIASASKDQSVRVWNAKDGTLVASLDANGEANSIAFSSDGRRLLIAADDGVRIWDFATNRTIVAFRGFADGIVEAEYALHDTRIVTLGADSTLRLWTVPQLPACQRAIDETRARMAHELTPALRNAESITSRHSPSILNALLPSQACS